MKDNLASLTTDRKAFDE